MATLTEIVAAVVVHSSAAAYSHFGVSLEPAKVQHPTPVAERVIARTPRPAANVAACLHHETPPARSLAVSA